jgi:ethanolamine-phosphate cytidylyltransferase/choline-phosphate cytidylyltransferase
MVVTVYTDMVGDLFHNGHVALLEACKQRGDVLIVGVCSDELVASYKRAPFMNMQQRATIIAACRYVDRVILDCPCPVTRAFIDEHAIDIVARGDDMNTPESIHRWYQVPFTMGILLFVPYTKGVSTTDLIEKIRDKTTSGVASNA